MRIGLWWVWLYGSSLILLSLYATNLLPSLLPNPPISNSKSPFVSTHPNITIFTAPEPFTGPVGTRQSLAIRSWLGLSFQVTVVLFSQHPSVVSFASSFGPRVHVDPTIDFTFLGMPYFHSMIERSRVYLGDISVFVDPETVLLPDFISILSFAHKLDNDWFLVASPRNVSYLPFHLNDGGRNWLRKEEGLPLTSKELQEVLNQYPLWNYCKDRMLLAWNNKDFPLHNAVLPPFLYRKGIHNHWIIREASLSEFRFVFDASWTIPSFSLWNPDDLHIKHADESLIGLNLDRNWERVGNSHLGESYGSLLPDKLNYSSLVKLIRCDHQYFFVDITDGKFYPLNHRLRIGHKGLVLNWINKKKLACIEKYKSEDTMPDCSLGDQLVSLKPMEFPFSLELLLSITSDENKSVVLSVAGYSYKDMLMSWVCRLRRLFVSNFLVCALDPETYEYAILQGLPVFRDPLAPRNISFDDCHFGTKCFQSVTKVKSRMVLKILQMGYNVLLSDVDVYWFRNPLPFLHSFGPAVLVGQSDEYNVTGAVNLPRRLNSGFYFARSDNATIAAMEKVVKHAADSNLSEQPSFYDSLCGEGGSNRISDDRCFDPETNLTVHFLDRNLFPNGAYLRLWQKKNVKSRCRKMGCFVLHNNWVNGRLKKLERQVLSGLWEYDSSRRMCLLN